MRHAKKHIALGLALLILGAQALVPLHFLSVSHRSPYTVEVLRSQATEAGLATQHYVHFCTLFDQWRGFLALSLVHSISTFIPPPQGRLLRFVRISPLQKASMPYYLRGPPFGKYTSNQLLANQREFNRK